MSEETKLKHAGGRPQVPFNDQYCDLLIEHMASGHSFESFVATLREKYGKTITPMRTTLYEWVEKYPQFSDAKKIGTDLNLYYCENIGNKGACGELKNFNATAWIFIVKNRHKDLYQDVNKTENSISLPNLPEDIIDRGLKLREAIGKQKLSDA